MSCLVLHQRLPELCLSEGEGGNCAIDTGTDDGVPELKFIWIKKG